MRATCTSRPVGPSWTASLRAILLALIAVAIAMGTTARDGHAHARVSHGLSVAEVADLPERGHDHHHDEGDERPIGLDLAGGDAAASEHGNAHHHVDAHIGRVALMTGPESLPVRPISLEPAARVWLPPRLERPPCPPPMA